MRRYPGRVENYTNAFLITTGILLFMVLLTLAATKGFVSVLLTAALIDGLIRFRAARLNSARIRAR